MVKPILFNSDMVRAILEGRKTVTRRVIKNTDDSMYAGLCGFGPGLFSEKTGLRVKEPYYRLGDILYVRETWNQLARVDENGYTHYNDLFYVYKADKTSLIYMMIMDFILTIPHESGAHLSICQRRSPESGCR